MRVTGFLACLPVIALCGCDMPGGGPDEVIRVGLIVPSGTPIPPLADIANAFHRVAQTAVEEVNARGGVNGRELVLTVRDPDFNPFVGPPGLAVVDNLEEFDRLGVVGAVGPVTTTTAGFGWATANALEIPMISPSSSAASLVRPSSDEMPELEDRFLFRNATDDRFQGLVMAHFLSNMYDDPATGEGVDPIDCAYVMHEPGQYGSGFSGAFTDIFQNQLQNPVKLTREIGAEAECDLACDVAAIAAAPPCDEANPDARRNVILIAFNSPGPELVVQAWDQMDPRPDIQWFLTDGARTPGFLAAAPDSVAGVVGTSRTNPVVGEAYEEFEDAYADRYPGERIAELAYTAQVWDAVWLFAAGLVLQEQRFPGEPFGGLELSRAIRDISSGPGVILHAGQWRDLLAAVSSGATVDFDGAAGPSNFDNCGETVGPYEIYRVFKDPATGEMTSEQINFLSTAFMQELRGDFTGLDNDCNPY